MKAFTVIKKYQYKKNNNYSVSPAGTQYWGWPGYPGYGLSGSGPANLHQINYHCSGYPGTV